MTEIKFRALDKAGNIIFGCGVQITDYDYDVLLVNAKESPLIQKNSARQLVGYDKFGAEVYKGDILEGIFGEFYIADFNGVWDGDTFVYIQVKNFKLKEAYHENN